MADSTQGNRKKILVIEDEPDIVRGLRDALEFEGFEVMSQGTGAEGLQAAADWGPDCVLLDLMLPDDNGYRVCETLRT
ncbi:MAG: response regulator, partial [Myxococcota bacterium]